MQTTSWPGTPTDAVDGAAVRLREAGRDPIVLRGGTGARVGVTTVHRLVSDDGRMLVVATGPYVGKGFDCASLDRCLWPRRSRSGGRPVQYVR